MTKTPNTQSVLNITPIAEWYKSEEGVVMRLPSGYVVKIRTLNLVDLLAHDDVVARLDQLTPVVAKLIEQGNLDGIFNPSAAWDAVEQLKATDELLKVVCKAMFVEPRIVDEPDRDKGEIPYKVLGEGDKGFIFGLIGRSAKELESFRDQTEQPLASVDAEPSVQ